MGGGKICKFVICKLGITVYFCFFEFIEEIKKQTENQNISENIILIGTKNSSNFLKFLFVYVSVLLYTFYIPIPLRMFKINITQALSDCEIGFKTIISVGGSPPKV